VKVHSLARLLDYLSPRGIAGNDINTIRTIVVAVTVGKLRPLSFKFKNQGDYTLHYARSATARVGFSGH